MNYLALKRLSQNESYCSILSKRFPVLLIDECQDLSLMEFNILEKLKEAGSIIHYIGDLGQSIYEFKDSSPDDLREKLKELTIKNLTYNFRNSEAIVNIANRIIKPRSLIISKNTSKLSCNRAFYIEYSDFTTLNLTYKKILEESNINTNNSAILVRKHNIKEKIQNIEIDKRHLLIRAIQYWEIGIPELKIIAMKLLGEQFQKWFGGYGSFKDYYNPLEKNDIFYWRIFLSKILSRCVIEERLSEISNMITSAWYKNARELLPIILEEVYPYIKPYDQKNRDFKQIHYRTPPGTADEYLNNINFNTEAENVKIKTIHSVKGLSFDSVMLVSSNEKNGWRWSSLMNQNTEDKRIGYVACTRAKYLLVLAVPKLKNKEEKEKLEALGFEKYSM